MNPNLTPEQLAERDRLFPRFQNFLNHCALQNEYRRLVDREELLNSWQRDRLAELRSYEKDSGRDFYNDNFR